jgi:tripartite-type tricarboxylate transporter receptor subunit TctC
MAMALQCVAAQTYPTRPIQLIMPVPGGGHEAVGRIMAEQMSKQLGQTVVVEGRPGASGNIGAAQLAKAQPDGYTIGLLSGIHTSNAGYFRQPGYDITRDFSPIGAIGETPTLLVARPDLPFDTVQALIAEVKANPGRLSAGGTSGLVFDLLSDAAGLSFLSVRYKSAGSAMTDLSSGRLDLTSGPSSVFLPLIKEKKIKAIAIGGSRRLPELPDVPTVAESGVPDFDASIWYGLFMPVGVPTDIAQRLRKEFLLALDAPEVRERMASQGIDLTFGRASQAALQDRIGREVANWKRIAAKTGAYVN